MNTALFNIIPAMLVAMDAKVETKKMDQITCKGT
jgi:hypothetical protein